MALPRLAMARIVRRREERMPPRSTIPQVSLISPSAGGAVLEDEEVLAAGTRPRAFRLEGEHS